MASSKADFVSHYGGSLDIRYKVVGSEIKLYLRKALSLKNRIM